MDNSSTGTVDLHAVAGAIVVCLLGTGFTFGPLYRRTTCDTAVVGTGLGGRRRRGAVGCGRGRRFASATAEDVFEHEVTAAEGKAGRPAAVDRASTMTTLAEAEVRTAASEVGASRGRS